ncbi:uncharacterized protein C8Q71DRAFT_855513 [Rhodofomes roseus]|uniref:Uncharacterized protein n=2 Tax=Rhodofomes roseus TaxID=34475 RepID=A0ABQ8KPT4_9APHY|nr:uncharacterized protein C8Q71DRAFT_855513 [Rhodofomes roseus]KAH9840234.1 hypothetical protein C8Q71DRAFT_855513 [Rhodofomes roseus]
MGHQWLHTHLCFSLLNHDLLALLSLCNPPYLPSTPKYMFEVMPALDFPKLPDGFPGQLEYKEDKWVYFSLAYPYGITAWVITELPGKWVHIPTPPEDAKGL